MTHPCLRVATLLLLAGCSGDAAVHRDSAPVSAADAGAPDAGPTATIGPPTIAPTGAAPQPAACDRMPPLSAWCGDHACPMQLEAARSDFCKNLSDLDTHTDTPLGPPPHVVAKNDCAGRSVTYVAAETKTRYDYGSDQKLLGVTLSGPQDGHTCNQTETTYGKACAVRAESELLCQCSYIACAAGVTFKLDAPTNLDSLENARIELCHNDLCTAGTSQSDIDFSPGSMPGIYFNALDVGSTAAFMLSLREDRPHAFVMFDVPDAKLHDGDRFHVRVTRSDGSKLYDHTETIVMYDLVGVGAPCTDHCQRKDLDHRSVSHEDAGI